jgi:hypothetical protein
MLQASNAGPFRGRSIPLLLRADFRSRTLAATEEVNALIAGRETKHEANEGVLVYLGNMRGAVAEALLGLDARDVDMFRVLMFFDLQLAQEAELVLLQNEHIRELICMVARQRDRILEIYGKHVEEIAAVLESNPGAWNAADTIAELSRRQQAHFGRWLDRWARRIHDSEEP